MHPFHKDKWKKLISDVSRLFEIEKEERIRERNTRQERKRQILKNEKKGQKTRRVKDKKINENYPHNCTFNICKYFRKLKNFLSWDGKIN